MAAHYTFGPRTRFPLSVHGSGRYLVDRDGVPFLIHGCTNWSFPVQWNDAEVVAYIKDRWTKGFTTILLNAIEHNFSSQSPKYNNVDGNAPFSSMTDFGSSLNSSYWARVDLIVNTCAAYGLVCIINPAYIGYAETEEGWDTEILAESDSDLQTYGARLAQRYTQGNVIWCMGGDADPNSTLRNKQWNIVTGIRSVRTSDLITAHGAPGSPAYTTWNGQTGFNLNTAYPGDIADVYSECATEYARSGPIPFFMIEGIYEQERGTPISQAGLRRQSYQALLSGACGQIWGNSPIWHGGASNAPFSYTGTKVTNQQSTGSFQQVHVGKLFKSVQWWKLVPTTNTDLVTTSLSSGDNRICPALANDESFALIWRPGSGSSTVDMSALGPSSVRARWYNTQTGAMSAVSGSPFANTGTQSFTWPGERVLVLDAA